MEIYTRLDKSKPAVRRALFENYKRKDFYTGDPLRFSEMHIDHIIPQDAFKHRIKLKNKYQCINLPDDFPQDCVINLVPTTKYRNSRKGASRYDCATVAALFEETRKHADSILQDIKRYENKELDPEVVFSDFIGCYQDKPSIVTDLINVFDDISKSDFEKLEGNKLSIKVNNIELVAYLPVMVKLGGFHIDPTAFYIQKTSCCVMIKNVVTSVQYTFDESQILEHLFSGGGTLFDSIERKYNMATDSKNSNFYIIDIIGDKSVSITLKKQDLIDFTKIMDLYSQYYNDRMEYLKN